MFGRQWEPAEGEVINVRYGGHPGNANFAGRTPHSLIE
jgi:hypothetical protein